MSLPFTIHTTCRLALSCAVVFCFAGNTAAQLMPPSQSEIKGFVEPYRTIDLAAAEMGILSKLEVKEGDFVQSNQILGRLSEDVLRASEAIVQETIATKGKLNMALAELKIQQETFDKVQGLFDRRHANQLELDRAEGQLEMAMARVEIAQDEERIKKFELQRIEAQLELRRLRSPIDGVVAQVYKDEGEFVSSTDPVVFKVVQLDPLLVELSVPHANCQNLQDGMQLSLHLGLNRVATQAFIEFVSPVADAQSGSCRVKLRVPNGDGRWQSGIPCFLELAQLKRLASDAKQPSADLEALNAKSQPLNVVRRSGK